MITIEKPNNLSTLTLDKLQVSLEAHEQWLKENVERVFQALHYNKNIYHKRCYCNKND